MRRRDKQEVPSIAEHKRIVRENSPYSADQVRQLKNFVRFVLELSSHAHSYNILQSDDVLNLNLAKAYEIEVPNKKPGEKEEKAPTRSVYAIELGHMNAEAVQTQDFYRLACSPGSEFTQEFYTPSEFWESYSGVTRNLSVDDFNLRTAKVMDSILRAREEERLTILESK